MLLAISPLFWASLVSWRGNGLPLTLLEHPGIPQHHILSHRARKKRFPPRCILTHQVKQHGGSWVLCSGCPRAAAQWLQVLDALVVSSEGDTLLGDSILQLL